MQLSNKIKNKLESLTQLPSIPIVMSEVLNAVDNDNISTKAIASIIEKDQSLTAKVLRVANSPFYGFSRRIATIDLAIVIMGLNTIKEIVLSLLVKRLIVKTKNSIFDIKSFWNYSLFCGAASRVLARKMEYRLVGEAFVAGLMHDVGYLIMAELFPREFMAIRKLQSQKINSLYDFEYEVIGNSHTELGEWFADKWSLPPKICNAILYHHSTYDKVLENEEDRMKNKVVDAEKEKKRIKFHSSDSPQINDEIPQQLTVIVALSEWFAQELGFKAWANETKRPNLYLADLLIEEFSTNDMLNEESAIEMLKLEIIEEFEKASVLNED
jgi:HD-like signal output (HDOD) protein